MRRVAGSVGPLHGSSRGEVAPPLPMGTGRDVQEAHRMEILPSPFYLRFLVGGFYWPFLEIRRRASLARMGGERKKPVF